MLALPGREGDDALPGQFAIERPETPSLAAAVERGRGLHSMASVSNGEFTYGYKHIPIGRLVKVFGAVRTTIVFAAAAMSWFVDHYVSGDLGAPDDPRVSPLLAPAATLRGGPSATVITSGYDPLRDEGVAYATRLAEEGVGVSQVHYPDQIHLQWR